MLSSKPIKTFFTSRYVFLLLLPVFIGAAILLWYSPPGIKSIYPPCPFQHITGFYCPGCGSLRAVYQLLHGHVLSAIHYNILTIAFLPVLVYEMFVLPLRFLAEKPLPHLLGNKIKPIYILVIILGYWVLRNVPIEPFSFLAPHL